MGFVGYLPENSIVQGPERAITGVDGNVEDVTDKILVENDDHSVPVSDSLSDQMRIQWIASLGGADDLVLVRQVEYDLAWTVHFPMYQKKGS